MDMCIELCPTAHASILWHVQGAYAIRHETYSQERTDQTKIRRCLCGMCTDMCAACIHGHVFGHVYMNMCMCSHAAMIQMS